MGPSVTGLGMAFEQYVSAKPAEFSSSARVLIKRPATFVRGFIQKMAEATNAGCLIDLGAVLDLCDWVTARPVQERTTFLQEDDLRADQNWQWTRDEIARFLESVCKAQSAESPTYVMDGFRQRIWQLIATLCHDPTDSYIVHDPSKDDPRL